MKNNGGEKVAKSNRTPNEQRSDSKNPTSKEYKSTMDNRSVQLDENQ